MKINTQKIIIMRQIWLHDIENVKEDFKNYLMNDCSEEFRFLMRDSNSENLYGIIDISNLKNFLEDEDFEENREEIPAQHLKQLEILLKIATENQLDEILFN